MNKSNNGTRTTYLAGNDGLDKNSNDKQKRY